MDQAQRLALLTREFDKFDRDRNGRIDYEEFRALLESIGPQPTEEEAQLAFSIIDTEENGDVSFDEFAHWWLDN